MEAPFGENKLQNDFSILIWTHWFIDTANNFISTFLHVINGASSEELLYTLA